MDPESASRQVTTLVSAGALVTFLPLLVISLLLARPMANRFRARFSVTLLALVSLAAILAATFRGQDLMMWLSHVGSGGGLAENAFGWLTDGESWRRVTHVDPGWLLNLALFVPAGILLALVTRRPLWTLLGLVAMSLLIEFSQDVTGLGSADPADLVANGLGACIGALVGGTILWLSPDGAQADRRDPPSRSAVGAAALIAAALVSAGWMALQFGADVRREALIDEIGTTFAGTSARDIEALLDAEDGFDELLAATATRPDYIGRVGGSELVEARYTVQFFGLYRCVFIRWDDAGQSLRPSSDGECTIFRDQPADA